MHYKMQMGLAIFQMYALSSKKCSMPAWPGIFQVDRQSGSPCSLNWLSVGYLDSSVGNIFRGRVYACLLQNMAAQGQERVKKINICVLNLVSYGLVLYDAVLRFLYSFCFRYTWAGLNDTEIRLWGIRAEKFIYNIKFCSLWPNHLGRVLLLV